MAISTWKSHSPHKFNTFKIEALLVSPRLLSSIIMSQSHHHQTCHWKQKIFNIITDLIKSHLLLILLPFVSVPSPSFVLILKFFVTENVVMILNYGHLAFILDYFNSFFTTKYKYFFSNTNLIMQFYFQSLYLKGQCLS